MGQRTADMSSGIRVEDVRWLYRYLGRITDAQLRDALDASGVRQRTPTVFAVPLRERIEQIGRAGSGKWQP